MNQYTVTLGQLKKAGACERGYKQLTKSLGGARKYGINTPIPLTKILESNGLADFFWVIRNVKVPNTDRVYRLMACDFAESVLYLFEDKYPGDNRVRNAIETARKFAEGNASLEELNAAWGAAWDAARDAAWGAAWGAARAASNAAWDAARDAAWGAAWDARDAARAASNAARAAARDAAWGAAWDAARDAAWGAAWGAASDAEAEKQIGIIKKWLGNS